MKRFLFFVSVLAALSLAFGCSRGVADDSLEGDSISVTFNVSLPEGISTKAVTSDEPAMELLFRAHDADGNHLEDMDRTFEVSNGQANFTANLVRGVGYRFVFWAQKPNQYSISYNSDGQPEVKMEYTSLQKMMNKDAYDAFYAVKDLMLQAEGPICQISLARPFAQLNACMSAADYATVAAGYDLETVFQTRLTVGDVPSTLNLFTGAVSGQQEVTYNYENAPADNITVGGEDYRRIAMVYVLSSPGEPSLHNTSLEVMVGKKGSADPAVIAKDVPNVPLAQNHRTNLVGSIFSVSNSFTILVDNGFGTPQNIIDQGGNTPGEVEIVAVKDQDYLAANKDGDLDVNISYTNSSSYTPGAAVSELRVYKLANLVIGAKNDCLIKKIELTCTATGTSKYGPGAWGNGAPDGYSFESNGNKGTWVGSAQSVTFTASNGQVRITNIKVTYVKK